MIPEFTQRQALEYIRDRMENHPMFSESASAAVMRGDYSEIENASDSETALTSELAAVCSLALSELVQSRAEKWHAMSDADLRLHCGELTASEIRAIRAVLNAIVSPTERTTQPLGALASVDQASETSD